MFQKRNIFLKTKKFNTNNKKSFQSILLHLYYYSDKPLAKYKSDMTAAKMIEASIDEKPAHVKYEYLLKRCKEYHNFALYLSKQFAVVNYFYQIRKMKIRYNIYVPSSFLSWRKEKNCEMSSSKDKILR